MEFKDIKELILTIDKTSINEIEIEEKDLKVRISKQKQIVAAEYIAPKAQEVQAVNTVKPVEETVSVAEKAEVKTEDENMYVIKSPIVGTFYSSSSPDSEDYVKVGSKVKAGDVVCIVEAMKIMNEIKSEVAGEVYEILVENEDIVEYNQPLMILRR